jgi:hypothetical protein
MASGRRPSKKTCDLCKMRHQRCNSSQPCSYCIDRDILCVYSTTPTNQLTASSVRRLASRAETPSLPGTEQRSPNRETSGEEFPASPFKGSLQYFVDVLGEALLDDSEDRSALSFAVCSGYTDATDAKDRWRESATHAIYSRYNLPPETQLQSFLDSFLDGPNKIIFACEPSESQSQLDDLYYQSKDINHTSLSLILLQVAIGAQTLGGIPHETCSNLYESGRRFMEVGIERTPGDWLWVVQAHILDCIYSMNAKPKMCWVILGK